MYAEPILLQVELLVWASGTNSPVKLKLIEGNFHAWFRENILFGKEMDSQRYSAVLEACQLVRDVADMRNGDLTAIGERGVTLSGGQRSRLSLARAIYQVSRLYTVCVSLLGCLMVEFAFVFSGVAYRIAVLWHSE